MRIICIIYEIDLSLTNEKHDETDEDDLSTYRDSQA